jgi:CDP-diacylglycerol--glycerol-3-phosphate 3-phosphatidyltransferase
MDRGVLTLPNIISLSRIALAAIFVAIPDTATRVALIAIAAATDFLDGWVARRQSLASRFGALIDPLADRVFVLAAITTFLFSGAITTAQYFMLIARDLATAIGFLVARAVSWLRNATFQARLSGKIVTVLQLIALCAVLIVPERAPLLILAVAIYSAWAIIDYTLMLWRVRTP